MLNIKYFLMCLCTVFISLESLAQSATVQITASETYLGKAASGIISIRYSNITLGLRRPLIVAEGFDPGHITSPEKRFGETNINTGFLDEARDITLSANLAALLGGSTQQYDIVYVNWSNGTDYMQRNALLLEEVIRWVNNNKVAVGGVVQPNVVLGQSMGGVIARWTLKDMEDKGQNHQTRLFISYDAPHQGANVPQGYQHLARHTRDLYVKAAPLAGPVETIQFFRGRQSPFHALSLSNEPAARQMLVNYINDINLIDNSLHNAWQTELKNKGYPQGVSGIAFRRVAVSNGSECATSQPFAAGSVLLSYNGKGKASFWGDLAADVVMPAVSLTLNQPAMGLGLTLPGNTSMSFEMEVKSKADGSSNQIYKGKVTYTKKVLGLINVTAVLTSRSFTSSSSTLPYDNFPGGYYDVSKAFDLSSSPISNDLIKFNATVQQQSNFFFIPTPSALDIGGGNVSLAKADYLTSYVGATPPSAPKNTPFQNFITAFSDGSANNEEHISILRRNGDWVAAELNNTNPVANCSVFCNSLSITGTAALCTSATYSVQAIAGATYTWTALPAGSVTFSGSGNSVTATRNGTYSGNATIKVLVSLAACGTGFPSLPVTVGPQPTAAVYGDWDNPLKIIAGADPVTGATSYKWYVNNVYIKSTTNPNTSLPYNGDCYTSVTVGVEVVTSCGTSGKTNTNIGTAPCDNFYIIAPNPAQDIITITAGDQTGMAAKAGVSSPSASSITQVKIYNAHGAAVKTIQYTGTTKQAQVNVADLTAGLYFIEVSNGNNRQTKRLVIAR